MELNKPTRYFSKRQEKGVAKRLSGKVQPNSGATKFYKGDVVLDNWLIECKTKVSESQSISIKKEWISKNEEEAFAMGKEHNAICFNFGGEHGVDNYYIISEDEFRRLVNCEKVTDNDD